jgi:hypothetical protein
VADSLADGMTRVAYVPTISNNAAPTVAELNAGILLQQYITADGIEGYEASTAEIETTSVASTFDTKTIGRDSFSGTLLRLKKQTGTDTVYDTLVRGVTGYTVIRRDVTETTVWTIGQKVEVYPIICGQAKFLKPEPNSIRKYEVPTTINAAATLRATIA